MYQPSQQDWVTSLVIAALGAASITSVAVLLGQDPFVSFAITSLAAITAVTLERCWRV